MKKKFMFMFSNKDLYEMYYGVSNKHAVIEMSKFTHTYSDTLVERLRDVDDNDIDKVAKVYNKLNLNHQITRIYIYDERWIIDNEDEDDDA